MFDMVRNIRPRLLLLLLLIRLELGVPEKTTCLFKYNITMSTRKSRCMTSRQVSVSCFNLFCLLHILLTPTFRFIISTKLCQLIILNPFGNKSNMSLGFPAPFKFQIRRNKFRSAPRKLL